MTCTECDGRGTVLDAPADVLTGRSYLTTCPECQGTGKDPAWQSWTVTLTVEVMAASMPHAITAATSGAPMRAVRCIVDRVIPSDVPRAAIPSATSPNPAVQAPPNVVTKKGFEGG